MFVKNFRWATLSHGKTELFFYLCSADAAGTHILIGRRPKMDLVKRFTDYE
jgi:hypothetical protein